MRILFVHASVDMSIGDVGRGYKNALVRQGHQVFDFHMNRRLSYHNSALRLPRETPEELFQFGQAAAKLASEPLINEAMYCDADVVLIVSGLNVHPLGAWALYRAGYPVALILTESPYDDEPQKTWIDAPATLGVTPLISVFTNDRYSAETMGWTFLPPSYDPAIHKPTEPSAEFACDVLMVGTGWPERQQFLEKVDWTGIDLRLYGVWPGLNNNPDSPLHKFYYPSVISNQTVPQMYCSAKININLHRASPVALTPGPRVYELAACGAFQLSDAREDLKTLFRDSVPTFSTPEEFGRMVRYYLANPGERELLAARSLDAVCDEDFDKRAATLIDTLERTPEPVQQATDLVGATEGD